MDERFLYRIRTKLCADLEVPYKKLNSEAIPFKYSRTLDACMDIYSNADVTVNPGTTAIIPTGIALEIPEGFEGIIRGRSGLSSKGLQVQIGTIDSTYRGEIGVMFYNSTDKPYNIKKGNRIAQFTLKPIIRLRMVEKDTLSETERGERGYGSSGK